jgi:uncharacterized damage-inducible protein DinB
MADERTTNDPERQDFIGALAKQRGLMVQTVTGLSEEQARLRPTVSALCLGGLIKHVTTVERNWSSFITQGTSAIGKADAGSYAAHAASFEMTDDETVPHLLEQYEVVGRATDRLVISLPSLDLAHPLPDAPWFEQGASWSARRVLAHVIAETAQHSGHADIIRESIDGARTMG